MRQMFYHAFCYDHSYNSRESRFKQSTYNMLLQLSQETNIYDLEKPYYFSGTLEQDQENARTNLVFTYHNDIPIRDLRGVEHQLKLNIHGFQLLSHTSSIDLVNPDDKQLQEYLVEVSDFIKDQLKAEVVLCYNYRVSVVLKES